MSKVQIAVLFAVLAATLKAQTGAGQIQGTIVDASGAVVPGVSVVLDNSRTGNRLESQTNAAGAYVFPSVQAGDYTISASSAGF